MGFFDNAKKSLSHSLKKGAIATLDGAVRSNVGLAQVIGAVGAIGLMTGLIKPPKPCPAPSGDASSSGGGAGDPCGKKDDSIKGALLGMATSLATPYLSAINSVTSGAMNSVSSALGSAAAAGVAAAGGAMGLDPSGVGQQFLNNVTKSATSNLASNITSKASEIASNSTHGYVGAGANGASTSKSAFDSVIDSIT